MTDKQIGHNGDVAPSTKPHANVSAHEATLDDLTPLRHADFAVPLEDMEKLLSQSRRAFMLGAGCGKIAGLPLMDELTSKVLSLLHSGDKAQSVLKGIMEHFHGASVCTVEDLMSELVDLVSIAQRRELRSTFQKTISINGTDYTADDLLDALSQIKRCIADCIADTQVKIDEHRRFVRSVHGALQAGKAGRTQAIDYFTLNYDTLLEDALGLEQIPNLDGFSGGATGWWSPEGYADKNISTRVFKVHGSIDWCLWKDDVFPRRLRPGLSTDIKADPVLIWPASTKYREAQRDPFAQILQMMRQSLRPETGSEVVLSVCGYAFGDEHINTEIERALFESDQRLTVLVFTSEDRPKGRLEEWLKEERIKDQVRVYANRGFFHGAKESLSDKSLPWWKFEVIARLLEGQR